jgi:hypothetical protein
LSRPDISLLHKTSQVRKRKIDRDKIYVWLSDKMASRDSTAEERRAERKKRAIIGPLPDSFLRIPGSSMPSPWVFPQDSR